MLGTSFVRMVGILMFLGAAMRAEAGVRHDLPEGYRVWARAESLAALASKTKAALTIERGPGDMMLMWTSKATTGRRYFRLATAVCYEPKGGKREWVVTEADDEAWLIQTGVLPRVTITTQGRPKEDGMGAATWWHAVSSDAKRGTVYEVEYCFQLAGEAAQGWRLVVMEDAAGRWRFVANVTGDYWDDTGYVEQTQVGVRWTGQADQPVELTEQSCVEERLYGGPHPLRWRSELLYTGKLPLRKAVTVRHYLVVRKGDTFGEMTKEMVTQDKDGLEKAVLNRAMRALGDEIMGLNAGLDVEHLAVGQEIAIPDETRLKTIIGEARRKAVLKEARETMATQAAP